MVRSKAPARPQPASGLRRLLDPTQSSYRWCIACTVTFSGFLVALNQSAVQIALPQIMTVFGLDVGQAQWLVTAYTIAGALLVPTVGWLGQWLGNRTLYLLSFCLFLTASILCACAWSGTSLMTFRVLQGLGGSPIPPMTMAFLSGVFPPDQRGKAMGLFGMGQTAGPILGAVLGGYLTEHVSWRAVFLMNIAPGLLCLLLIFLVLPQVRDAGTRALDGLGLSSMSLFLISLLVAVSQGQREGWDAPFIQRLWLLAGVALVVFLAREWYAAAPLIDLRLYTNRTFAAASGVILLFFMAFAGSTFLQVLLVQQLLDYTPAQAGFVLLPGSVLLALSFPLAGRLADRYERRLIMLCALSIFALASYLFSAVSLAHPLSWIIWLVMLRFGSGSFVYAPLTAAAMADIAPEKMRMGSGLLYLMQNGLGNTLGLAVITTVLQQRQAYHRTMLDQQQVFSALTWEEVVAPVRALVQQHGASGSLGEAQVVAFVQRHLEQQATVAAYQDCFMFLALLALACIPLVLLLRQTRT